MCAIVHLKAGVTMPMTALENACYNNWHSFGIVIRKPGKLEIIKEVPKSGEIDPDDIQEILNKNKEFERFLHVRHNTAGATNLENTHPFDVYEAKGKNGRKVVFMHNGTLYTYKSKMTTPDGRTIDDDSGPSDTKNFVDQVLIPYLGCTDFGKGRGDIESPMMMTLLRQFWTGTGNRGLLISSDQTPLYLGDWKKITREGVDFLASNDEYFDAVKRGPEFERRKQAEEEKKKAEAARFQAGTSSTSRAVSQSSGRLHELKEFTFGKKHPFFDLSASMAHIVNDWDIYDRHSAVSLGCASVDELAELYKSEKDCLFVMDWIFTDYYNLYQEHLKLTDKHEKATKMIASLQQENVEERRVM